MRLDKYLKVSRIIRRRSLAKEVSDSGRIYVNHRVAKSSTPIKIDDIIAIKHSNKSFIIRVLKVLDSTKKEDASSMYEIIEETYLMEDEQ